MVVVICCGLYKNIQISRNIVKPYNPTIPREFLVDFPMLQLTSMFSVPKLYNTQSKFRRKKKKVCNVTSIVCFTFTFERIKHGIYMTYKTPP